MKSVVSYACFGAIVSVAMAQPSVPAGFAARRIAPILDNSVVELSAIQSATFGEGVVTASTSSGVTTFRLIEPTGVISVIESFADARVDYVQRVRFDVEDVLPGEIHATLVEFGANAAPPGGQTTIYITIDSNGGIVQRFESGTIDDERAYDFVLTSDLGDGSPGAVFLDRDGTDGTSLATMGAGFSLTEQTPDSNPFGNNDTDVEGFREDPIGIYGGAFLLADSDCNSSTSPDSTLWSLSDPLTGGAYSDIASPVACTLRRYGDLDIVAAGPFGGVIYITEQVSNEIQQVAPDGTHTTWATGFAGIDALSIAPDGESMYVADLNGLWLIRPDDDEPGPAILAADPSSPAGSPITGDPLSSARVIFTELVTFTDTDVTITDRIGGPVAFNVSGSGSQFMIIGFAQPLFNDEYTITISDTLTSVGTGQPLDGDNDGVAGVDAILTIQHRCAADASDPPFLYDLSDVDAFIQAFTSQCATP
ncbi:MAG: hypothetical protein AAGI53_15360 [Planctomycetota bacterium]